ncbi:MAG: hypothetical protein H6Q89_3213 [Myxococcaceae bacterium]|nr:hypothetical protein [Myxococcaceae bacterium]
MCSQTTCRSCGKPTWAGCGAHIEQALANVPRDARCKCREATNPKAPQAVQPPPGSGRC